MKVRFNRLLGSFVATGLLVPIVTSSNDQVLSEAKLFNSAMAPVSASFASRIHRHFSQQAQLGRFAGSVAVVYGRETLFRRSYGLANLSEGSPHRPDIPFPLASISKQFLAAGILKAASLGLLDLKAPVSQYLPQTSHWAGMTLEQLLSHSSGLKQLTRFPNFYTVIGSNISLSEIFEMFLQEPLNGSPGQNYEYSQYGYHVLAHLLETVSGKPYSQFLKENLFDPARMRQTLNYRETMAIKNLVRGSKIDATGVSPAFFSRTTVGNRSYEHYISMSALGAGGDLVASLDDFIRWEKALRGDRVLSRTERDLYHSELFRIRDGLGYGFGLSHEAVEGHPTVSHGGGLAGISTAMIRFLDVPLSIIVLSNRVCAFPDNETNKTCSAGVHARTVATEFFRP